jgi:hypothetical protein
MKIHKWYKWFVAFGEWIADLIVWKLKYGEADGTKTIIPPPPKPPEPPPDDDD